MTARRPTGLGRGLGDLIRPTVEAETPERKAPDVGGARFEEVDVTRITPNPRQPRQVFDEDELVELVESIREVGLLQPVVVRPIGDDYELVMGERRLRAVRTVGLATIPAIVRDTAEHDLLRDALLENLHRAQLNPLEEAAAYQQMLDDFDCSHEELAGRIKRSRPHISNTLRLLKLPAPVQRRVAVGVLSAGHARALLSLPDAQAMEWLAQRIVAEGLSVRTVEEIVALGEQPLQPVRPRRVAAPSPLAADLSERLTDRFDTRVNVSIGRRKGRIVIEFAGQEDLDRIMAVIEGRAI